MANEKDDKRFKATTPGKRFLKLAGMSASIAKNVASHKVKEGITHFEKSARTQVYNSLRLG